MPIWEGIRAGRSTAKSTQASQALLAYVQRIQNDMRLLKETVDEDLPLLVNYVWGAPSLKKEYFERIQTAGTLK